MLNLKEFRFKGIGRFTEEQVIDFDKLGNLVQVDGENHNTGGSSGAGKSTIFNALDFLLGLNSTPTTVLQSRLTEEPLFIEGRFELDGKPVTISRGKKLKIEIDGEVTSGSSKISEEKLDQLLSIPRHLVRPMIHKKQGEKGFFLNFTPKETNDFLTDCLGLGHFKKHLLTLDTNLQEFGKKKDLIAIEVESARSSLLATESALLALGASPKQEVDREVVLRLKAKAEASREEMNRILALHQKETIEYESFRPVPQFIPFDKSDKAVYEQSLRDIKVKNEKLLLDQKDEQHKYEARVQTLRNSHYKLQQKIDQGNEAKVQATKFAEEIKKIRDNTCPKCDQTWLADSAKKEEENLFVRIKQLRAIVGEGVKAAEELTKSKETLENLEQPLAVPIGWKELQEEEKTVKALLIENEKKETAWLATQNEKNVQQQSLFNLRFDQKKDRQFKESETIRGQAALDARAFETAVMNMKSYEAARIRYENSFNTLKSQEKLYIEKMNRAGMEFQKIEDRLLFTEELKKAVKSFLSCSFDEALEAISNNATTLVRNVPNMANATVQLSGTRETKEGKVKEEVTAVLHLDGDENIDIRSLCGGERSAIDLAIDLSVIDLIEQKTGKGMNVLILDEPFTGLDSVCIEMALEVLKNSNPLKKIIVVDHNPIVKEAISDRVLIVREGLTSIAIQN